MRRTFIFLFLITLTADIACNTRKTDQGPPVFTIRGTLTTGAGIPVGGETVCVAPILSEELLCGFRLSAKGVELRVPNGVTDAQGNFTINVGSEFLETYKQFTSHLTAKLALVRNGKSPSKDPETGYLKMPTVPHFLPISKDGEHVKLLLVASGTETKTLALGTLTVSME